MDSGKSEPRMVFETWLRRVWNEGDASAIDEMFKADGLAHGLGPEPMVGPEHYKPLHAAMHAVCTSITTRMEQVVEQGDMVSARVMFTLDHKKGDGPIDVEVMAMCRIENGQIAEAWNNVDWIPALMHTGLLDADVMQSFMTP
jgi:ketosteroid isomerase-like protein